jgi:hypothetical protein
MKKVTGPSGVEFIDLPEDEIQEFYEKYKFK